MSEPLAGRRLLVVEEALKDPVGHWYEYIKAVVELNRAAGVEVVTAVHAEIEPAIARELAAIPAFPRTPWDGDYAKGWAPWRYFGLLRHNWLVYRTMRRIVDGHGPFDCLFAPTVAMHHLWGWRLLWARRRAAIGRMVLLFRNSPGTYPRGSVIPVFKRRTAFFKCALRSFREGLRTRRVAFATDSDRLAREYDMLAGVVPEVFPSPRIAPFLDRGAEPRLPDEPLVFSCLGPARFEKGIDLLQQAIAICLRQGLARPVRFVIQWNQPIRTADGAVYEPDPALVADERVEFITKAMTSAEYDAAIATTDCMLLPYRRVSYYARISGVAVEAATAGIPMLYTADTWTADLAKQMGAGMGVSDGDVAAIAAAIRELAENHEPYRALARERTGAAQAAHSPDAFLARLWGTA